ncbi:hypothetical protein QAD02_006630 [Eretmocerus hayati]|uniref:Uncharacterized protein n=1 Tax=Eretmocerus hayati TaxID=131215 RepID=A0ACC2N2K3_9HYME|nr:hypothetical protein QAD02_006630 [Eretmocerus hayati]
MLIQFFVTFILLFEVRGDPGPFIPESFERNSIGVRIRGGEEAPPDIYHFVVSVMDKGHHRCGGTIISKSVILTAAHCLDDTHPWDFSVRVGSLKMDSGGNVYRVVNYVRPREYHTDRFSTKYDVALLKLESPLPTDGKIKPVKLYWPKEEVAAEGTIVTSVGWGLTWSPEDNLKTLRYVHFPLLSSNRCAYHLRNYLGLIGQLCAWSPGKAACRGDSGGPLLLGDRQIGIASVALDCPGGSLPTIYTDVTFFRDWIERNLWHLAGEVVNEWDVKSAIYFPES